ncbi:hypothetical protein ACOSQ4_016603 [Xanthoceras sorbifolium]
MTLSNDLKDQLYKPWENAVILKIMGHSHTLNFMFPKLKEKWPLIGHWQLTDLEDGYFIACFQMREDLELKIGGMLRSTCKVDPIIESQARCHFATFYVEIDLSKPLKGALYFKGRSIRVEYESLGADPAASKGDPYGPWLVVSYGKNRGRVRSFKKKNVGGYVSKMERNFRFGGTNGRIDAGHRMENNTGKEIGNRVESNTGKEVRVEGSTDNSKSSYGNGGNPKYLKKKVIQPVNVEEDMKDVRVLQQLHQDVLKFKGNLDPKR